MILLFLCLLTLDIIIWLVYYKLPIQKQNTYLYLLEVQITYIRSDFCQLDKENSILKEQLQSKSKVTFLRQLLLFFKHVFKNYNYCPISSQIIVDPFGPAFQMKKKGYSRKKWVMASISNKKSSRKVSHISRLDFFVFKL